jgi:hypothetical protein
MKVLRPNPRTGQVDVINHIDIEIEHPELESQKEREDTSLVEDVDLVVQTIPIDWLASQEFKIVESKVPDELPKKKRQKKSKS